VLDPAPGRRLAAGFYIGLGFVWKAFNLDTTRTVFWAAAAGGLLCTGWQPVTGFGYARYLQTQQRSQLWRGYGRAVIMHGLWNACALTMAFIGIAMGLSAFTLNVLLVCLAGLLVVLPAILMVLLIRRVARAGVQSSIQEDYQQAGVLLPGSWSPMKFNFGWRFVGSRPIEGAAEVASPAEPAAATQAAHDSEI
jgi:hypothetical protein